MNRYIEFMKKTDKSIYTVIACILVWIAGNVCMESVFAKDKVMGTEIVLLVFTFYLWYVYRHKKDEDKALRNTLLLLGFLLRVIYIWAVPNNISAHDLGNVLDTGEVTGGHLGYISYIYHYGRIPNMDPRTAWAYYNPPLYHIISAIWLKINTTLGIEWNQAAENLQILTLLYSSLSVVVFEKILDEFAIKDKVKNLILCFFGTFPMLIWLSGNLTTDSLVLLFALCIMLYTIRWYKKRDMKTIVILALCIGCGMITKISLGFFAISVGAIFILGFVEAIRKDKTAVKKCILQYAVFLLICAPIGLSWSVRNSVRFDLEPNYVQNLGENSGQYIGNADLVDRIGIPSLAQMSYAKMCFDTEIDTNIWMSIFRTAIYDEWYAINIDGEVAENIGIATVFVNIFLGIFMFVLFLIMLVRKSEVWKLDGKLFFSLTYLVYFISYIKFCFDYPQICTMNFRYITFMAVIPMLGAGLFLTEKENKVCMKILTFACFLANGMAALLYLKFCMLQ